MKKENIAAVAVWLLIATFLGVAMWQFLHASAAHGEHHPGEESGESQLATILYLVVACLLFFMRRWLVKKLTRFFLVSAVFLALLVEPLLHWWGIPHPEGLWLPYMEGGAAVGALVRYWRQIKSAVEHWLRTLHAKGRH